jgi:NAD(P)-dependent dehydrogenase (short-subunit alcohol dehydrogenase family)
VATLFDTDYRALVIGASGAIGGAFVESLQQDRHCVHVKQLSRSDGSGFDLLNPQAIADSATACLLNGPYQLIIDATGGLTINGVGPEKSLAAINAENLARSFAVNATGPMLVLRHFAPLLASGPVIYAKLSARVGSISDNHKGGWYSYRASKAALNMLLQTTAIELQRKNPLLNVVALQPGTVRSRLSQPFSANVPKMLEPAESAAGMLGALRQLEARQGAYFVDYQGQEIPW